MTGATLDRRRRRRVRVALWIIGAVASVLVTLYAGYAELGHLDPAWFISSMAAFLMAGIIALVTGLPFRILRTLDREDG